MKTIELSIVGLLIAFPERLKKIGDFEPTDFELRDLFRVVEKWIDDHRDGSTDETICERIFRTGNADLAAWCLTQDADESLFDEYLEAWREE